MSEENQKIYEQYSKPLAASIYSGLADTTADGWVPATAAEPFVQQYFEISSEEMRSLSSILSY